MYKINYYLYTLIKLKNKHKLHDFWKVSNVPYNKTEQITRYTSIQTNLEPTATC